MEREKKIIFGDKFPFRYLADAYGLEYDAAFPGCSAEMEPSAASIARLIIFPSLIAMRVVKSFRGVVLCSAAVSVAAFFAGMVLSYGYGTPAGASVVLVNLVFLVVFGLAGRIAAGIRKSYRSDGSW